MGSGSLVDNNGLIITNWHVIAKAKEIKVWLLPKDATRKEVEDLWRFHPYYLAKVIHTNKKKDLALIKIEDVPKNLKVIKLGGLKDIKIV